MKTYKHLWEKLVTKENFDLAYKNSIKRKGKQRGVQEFQKNPEENLEAVRKLVESGQFHTSEYREMTVYEPKERIIYKLPYCPDRIVQHAIMNVLKPILKNLFIENSFACVEGRGPHKASKKCAELVRKYDYCLKCDIKKFFPSVNQTILSGMFHRIVKDERFMELLDDIIFSYPGGYNCPIGNFCSQWFGNFYLTPLDNFVLHELKCKGYMRYSDDFILCSNDKEYLKQCKERIRVFLMERLELTFSKADVFHTKQGIDYCGYRHFKKYLLLRKSTAKRIKKRMSSVEVALQNNPNIPRIRGQVASANGQLKHCCAHHLRRAIKIDELMDQIKELEQNVA